jgi:hypothetical protein
MREEKRIRVFARRTSMTPIGSQSELGEDAERSETS